MSRYAIRTAGDAVTSYFEFKRYSEESSHAIRTPRGGRRLFTPPAVNRRLVPRLQAPAVFTASLHTSRCEQELHAIRTRVRAFGARL